MRFLHRPSLLLLCCLIVACLQSYSPPPSAYSDSRASQPLIRPNCKEAVRGRSRHSWALKGSRGTFADDLSPLLRRIPRQDRLSDRHCKIKAVSVAPCISPREKRMRRCPRSPSGHPARADAETSPRPRPAAPTPRRNHSLRTKRHRVLRSPGRTAACGSVRL